MSKAARTDAPAPHAADRHDRIRVHGARVNNLKDISVELPKRRLTAFTGVSGSGKSSLVFGTIAAESQRLINETYSTFVQGFMPTMARPDVDVLDGITTAILVDQERMGANVRSTVGTATDANAMLRILFSRLGQPHIGSPNAFSFNTAAISGAGAVTFEKAGKTTREKRSFTRLGGMCPACEGIGSVSDFDLAELYDDTKSLNEGALKVPGYSMSGWSGRIFRGCGFFDPDKPIAKFTKKELAELLYKEPTKVKIEGLNLTYSGVIPRPPPRRARRRHRCRRVRQELADPRLRVAPRGCGDHRPRGHQGLPSQQPGHLHGPARADPQGVRQGQRREAGAVQRQLRGRLPRLQRRRGDLHRPRDHGRRRHHASASPSRPSRAEKGEVYVLDEPTTGLHLADVEQLLGLLDRLVDGGRSVIVIEHHQAVMAHADWIVDLGPGAGQEGGRTVFEGTPAALVADRTTLTGEHLADYVGA